MAERNIGEKRTFDDFDGTWEIIDVIKSKELKKNLKIGTEACPFCGKDIGKPRNYRFRYIEKLENKETSEIKYMGISTGGRYIILTDFFTENEISTELGG